MLELEQLFEFNVFRFDFDNFSVFICMTIECVLIVGHI